MRSLISPIQDIFEILRDELAYRKVMRDMVFVGKITIPDDRVREFLALYDRVVNDPYKNTPRYSRATLYDMRLFISTIAPDTDNSFVFVAPDFTGPFSVDAFLYSVKEPS